MNIKLTEYGIDDTLKHSIELLDTAIGKKSAKDKDKLMYQVVGELDTLFRCIEVKEENNKHEADNNND